MNHVINDQTSLGSHPQYLPQAILAQIAPDIIPIVKNGNPMLIALYPIESNFSIVIASDQRNNDIVHLLPLETVNGTDAQAFG